MIHWLVADRRGDAAIGSCSLFRFDARHRRAEVGYALRSDRWGRGLAAEAVALALDWGFRTLALHRIEAGIDPRNDASRRLLERLGFRREGLLRNHRRHADGTPRDTVVFSIIDSEWPAVRRHLQSLLDSHS